MISCAGLTAIALMTFYFLIPFLVVVRGAPVFLAMLRPFALSGSVLAILAGVYWTWRSQQSGRAASGISIAVLWFSAVTVLIMILFPQAVANLLASR